MRELLVAEIIVYGTCGDYKDVVAGFLFVGGDGFRHWIHFRDVSHVERCVA